MPIGIGSEGVAAADRNSQTDSGLYHYQAASNWASSYIIEMRRLLACNLFFQDLDGVDRERDEAAQAKAEVAFYSQRNDELLRVRLVLMLHNC